MHLVLGGIFFFKSDRKILNDGHSKIFAAAYTEQVAMQVIIQNL